MGLFQVLPVHETGAPINRRVTALVFHLHVMLDVMGRVMLGRRRDGFDVVEDATRSAWGFASVLLAASQLCSGVCFDTCPC